MPSDVPEMISKCITYESPRRMVVLIPILLLLAIHGSAGARVQEGRKISLRSENQYCSGWMLNTASNNIVDWLAPAGCLEYITNYIEGGQYMVDFGIAIDAASDYLQTLEPTNGKDAVIFDMDDTTLSCLPYHKNHSYGVEPFDIADFNQWVYSERAPALKPTLDLYKNLQARNWRVIFVTSRSESQREVLTKNLIGVGFTNWDELILKLLAEADLPASTFKAAKRAELEKTKGYTVRSCIGDQWSDCAGSATGNRTFKIPNPMYFTA